MQNKGALKFLIAILAIASAYQLSFTFVTKHVENKAVKYAASYAPELRSKMEQHFLDSVRNETVYNLGFMKYTYKDCQDKEINLGLDLRGGMNVMLEISVEDIIMALSNNNQDPLFIQALEQAKQDQRNSSDDYITLFSKAYSTLSNNAPLAYIFNTPDLKEKINPQSSNDDVLKVLRAESESAVANSYNVLRNRIDRFGVAQPNVQRLENSGRILVELPGVKEPERVRKLLQGTASLEFWATYDNSEISPLLQEVNQVTMQIEAPTLEELAKSDVGEPVAEVAEAAEAKVEGELDALLNATDSTGNKNITATMTSLFSKMSPSPNPGAVIGFSSGIDTAAVNKYFSLPQVKAILPRDVRLLWGIKPIKAEGGKDIYELYAIKANTRDGKAPLDGGAVVDAKEEYSQHGASAEVSMVMNSQGAKVWARLTADNIGKSVAIVLDDYVYSAPRVNAEITGGRSSITGSFTIQEATDLANVLKSGKLPAPARIIQDTVVGPTLGQESINAGMMSFVLAFILVLLYMLFFYNTAGLVANIALLTNLFFLFGCLASFGAVLTLPGIAGIVLTMGMAVDANVIIYERIKEELRSGKGVSLSIKDGYKNAMSAIIDGNMTTLITGVVLFFFGTGPVQGFATTLIVGIITSLFTAIFVTRLVFTAMLEKNWKIKFSNKLTQNFLTKTRIDFIGIRKYTYIFSAVTIVVCIASLATRGLAYGVEFSGGRAYTIRFDQPVQADDVRKSLETVFDGGVEVKQFGGENQMRIITKYKYDDPGQNVAEEIEGMLYNALSPMYKNQLSFAEFSTTDTNPNGIVISDKVGPSVAHDIKRNSFIAVAFALLAIGLYIALRFNRWQWALGGVVSLAHDALLIIGLFSLLHGLMPFNLEIDQAFIAAVLTIIGYSINDTVVIFDRIREYRTLHPKRSLRDNINSAINSTLGRTVNTAGTTLVVLIAIFLFGGEVIRGFIFALLFGIFLGTFSSIFVATPVAYDFIRRKEQATGEDA